MPISGGGIVETQVGAQIPIIGIAGTPIGDGGIVKLYSSLFYNFMQSQPLTGLTYNLSGGGLTYFDSTGTLRTAAANEWPLEYNPATLAPRGRPVWSQRTNDLLQSNDFASGAWDKAGLPVTVTAGQAIGPDGLASLTEIEASGGLVQHTAFSNTISVTAGVTRALTAYARAGAADWVLFGDRGDSAFHQAWFNLTTGAVGSTRGTVVSKTMALIRPGLYQIQVVYTRATTGTEIVAIGPAPADNTSTFTPAGESINAGFVQAETGAFPGPYIATAGTAATRNAPSITRTLGAEFNPAAWSMIIGAMPSTNAAVSNYPFGALVNTGDASNQNGLMRAQGGSTPQSFISRGSTASDIIAGGAYTPYVASKFGMAVAANNYSFAVDGALIGTDTNTGGLVPSGINIAYFGSAGGSQILEGWLQSFALYPQRLPNTTLQALTT